MNKILLLLLLLFFSAPATAQKGLGVIAGQALTPSGEPAPGLRIAALEATDEGALQGVSMIASITETDGEGRFRLEDIPAGRYYLVGGRIESPAYYPGSRDKTDAKAIVVPPGGTVSGIVFKTPILTVKGRIETAEEFEPFPSVINLRPIGAPVGPSGLQSVISFGSFEFTDVPPGQYTLAFLVQSGAGGIVAGPTSFQVLNGGGQNLDNRIVVTDRSVNDVIVSFGRPVRGRVVLDRDGPMLPFTMSFKGSRGPSFQTSAWKLTGLSVSLPMDDYEVHVSGVPAGYEVKSILYAATDILHAPLHVGAELHEMVVNIAVSDPPPWFRVGGRVTGAGKPTATGHSLRLIMRGDSFTTAAPLQPDGSFQFDQLLPGTYDARIEPVLEGLNPILIHVPDRDLSGIEIPLPGRRRVVGRVSTENGAAIPALRIALVGAESAVASASAVEVLPAHPELTPSEQGVFSVVVPVGEYRVVVQDLDLPYSVGSFTSGPADLLRDTLKVGAGDTENLALALSIPGFTVSGHVYAVSDGNSRDGSRLSLSGKTLRETLYVVSGPDSSFRFPSVPSGDYMLRVEPGDNSIRVLVNRADVVDVDLVSLRGRASAESGAPVAGVTVWFSTASDPLVFLTRTRDDGTFTVALTRGSYRVQLSAPSGYVLKALTAGTVDLTEETLPVSEAGPRELQAVLEPRVSGS